MLKKILRIIGISRFEDYAPSGNVEFRKLNLIYGDNGRGKSTLSSIFRSLKTNTPKYILERATIGYALSPQVTLLDDSGGKIEFKNKNWSSVKENFEIFDSHFITENVFSGDIVDHEHKKNLYRFVIGEKAVSKAQEVNRLDGEIRNKQAEITLKHAEISKYIIGKMSEDKFVELPTLPANLDNLIIEQKKEVETIKKSAVVISKPLLLEISIPTSPTNEITTLLGRSIAEISKDAEKMTLEHINTHLEDNGHSWIQDGLGYIKSEQCPFCGQNITGNTLIKAYQGYFNQAYADLKKDISSITDSASTTLASNKLLSLQHIFENNIILGEFWSEYSSFTMPSSPQEVLKKAWENLTTQHSKYLKQKSAAPLEIIIPTKTFLAAEQEFSDTSTLITAYNEEVKKINAIITEKKALAAKGDLNDQTEKLNDLQCLKIRNETIPNSLSVEYKKLKKEKSDLEAAKKAAKDDLDSFDKIILEKFEAAINSYLEKFGAVFRIADTKKGYGGGTPSSSYCIVINGKPIELEGNEGEPSFKTILSNGDKNTLAFAFFMARLDQDTGLDKKIVIFDDPITSLDSSRKTATKQEILKIAARAKQTFLLSHDLQFIAELWGDSDKSDLNCLQATRGTGEATTLSEWDVSGVIYNYYLRDLNTLMAFTAGGSKMNLIEVARCIRPVLEGYLRIKLPTLFLPSEWLGELIEKMRKANQTDLPASLQNMFTELSNINDYSKKFHHHTNPNADSQPISEAELKGYVQRALKIINA